MSNSWIFKMSYCEAKSVHRLPTNLHGGYEYYSDPTLEVVDRSQTHMIFGSRCEEVPTQLPNGAVIFGLRHETDQRKSEPTRNFGQALVNCVSSEPSLMVGKTVIEFGSSTFSVAAACLGASRVITCHQDELVLRQVEYAHAFLNTKHVSVPPVHSTYRETPGDQLPYLGGENSIVAFTDPDLSRLGEVFEQKPAHILVPTPLVDPQQLDQFRQNYPEAAGVFIITPQR